MNLEALSERVWYLPGANNLGVVATDDGGALLIDTGLSKDVARTTRKVLDAAGLELRAIISTHHHADHIGGNAYFVRNVPGVQVYAPPIEATLIEHPILEPVYLNYGATPFAGLRTRWLMASGSPVHHLISQAETLIAGATDTLTVAGVTFDVLGLPGHSIAQVGLCVDGVCFAADGFFGTSVIAKHGLLYAHDVAAQRASFERLRTRGEAWFVPGHGDLTAAAALPAALDANQAATQRASEIILAAISPPHEPGDISTVTGRVIAAYQENTPPDQRRGMTVPQYAIFAGAVQAHLTFLQQQKQATVVLDPPRGLLWQPA